MKRMFRGSLILSAAVFCTPLAGGETRVVTNAAEAVNWSAGVSYSYDGAGNISQIGSDKFAYDEVSRVVQATVNGVQRNYEYDAFGNRTKCQQPEGDCQYGLTIRKTDNRVDGAAYDAAGNVTAFIGESYSYDDLNMVTRDRTGNAQTKEFIYTADDERIATYTVGSNWTWTLRETSGKVLRELTSSDGPNGRGTASWNWSKDYVWRGGQLLASRHLADFDTVATQHYHLDHLGTPRRVTDDRDNTVGIHDYHLFGPEVPGGLNEPFATNLKYTGHERDTSINGGPATLDYMHARYYSPATGRFLSVDPANVSLRNMETPQRWNRYAYAVNNPLKFTDPDGLKDTIYIVNTTSEGVFNKTQQARLETLVKGTRFEGRVQVIGPMASAGQVQAWLGHADKSDLIAVIAHSGSSKGWAPAKGGMMLAEKRMQWMTGQMLASWASVGEAPGACMLAGCDSEQLAATVSAGASTLTFGTTENVVAWQIGNAVVTVMGSLAQGQTPEAAAQAGSAQLTIPANHCQNDPTCVNRPAKVVPCAQPTTGGTDEAGHPTPPPC